MEEKGELEVMAIGDNVISRFCNEDGKRKLIDCLQRQKIICGNHDLSVAISKIAKIKQYEKFETIIRQDDTDTDISFIISGLVSVEVNGREIATRKSGQHIGEMALIDPSATRSASVIALQATVVASVSEQDFSLLAQEHNFLWREIAVELCDRLRQRNSFVRAVNPRPVVFIGSSSESLPIANQLAIGLKHDDLIVRLWSDGGVFGASRFPIEDLASQVESSDFAILVLGPDDIVISRGKEIDAPRDNVIFELGLFMGALSRQRTFIILPNGFDIKIPSDLLGLTPITYQNIGSVDIQSAIAPVCDQLKCIVFELGPR